MMLVCWLLALVNSSDDAFAHILKSVKNAQLGAGCEYAASHWAEVWKRRRGLMGRLPRYRWKGRRRRAPVEGVTLPVCVPGNRCDVCVRAMHLALSPLRSPLLVVPHPPNISCLNRQSFTECDRPCHMSAPSRLLTVPLFIFYTPFFYPV